jgi:glycosyltransferase involved in cell wall biosynthesis
MLFGVAVVVVVPAWNEAPRIARVLRAMPASVDRVVVVDDASTDATIEAARAIDDARVEIASHATNRGVGAAIVTGYRRAIALTESPRDAFVVMAGDGQMDPRDLPALVEPIARGDADYVKGDRFRAADVARVMPPARLVGGKIFSWLTSHAIGVAISDSQCGYTALARAACERLELDDLWPGYGYPNDLLAQIARRGMRIAHAPVRPVYADEVSRLAPRHVARIAQLVGRAWVRRLRDSRA